MVVAGSLQRLMTIYIVFPQNAVFLDSKIYRDQRGAFPNVICEEKKWPKDSKNIN